MAGQADGDRTGPAVRCVAWGQVPATVTAVWPAWRAARYLSHMHAVGTTPDPVRYLSAPQPPVPCTAHGRRVRQARNTACTRPPSPVFPQLRSHLMRSEPRPGHGRIQPTHSPRTQPTV